MGPLRRCWKPPWGVSSLRLHAPDRMASRAGATGSQPARSRDSRTQGQDGSRELLRLRTEMFGRSGGASHLVGGSRSQHVSGGASPAMLGASGHRHLGVHELGAVARVPAAVRTDHIDTSEGVRTDGSQPSLVVPQRRPARGRRRGVGAWSLRLLGEPAPGVPCPAASRRSWSAASAYEVVDAVVAAISQGDDVVSGRRWSTAVQTRGTASEDELPVLQIRVVVAALRRRAALGVALPLLAPGARAAPGGPGGRCPAAETRSLDGHH